MTDKAIISLEPGNGPDDPVVCRIECNQQFIGHQAEFQIVAEVDVQDKSPVNDEKILYRQNYKIGSTVKTINIPRKKIRAYSYSGRKIKIHIHTRLEIDDALLFDTEISQKQQLETGLKPGIKNDARDEIEPRDIFNFFENLKAIPVKSQVITLGLAVVGGIIMLINALIGIHDQFVPDSMTYVYSHVDSDGDGQLPLVNALIMSGALGAGVWFAMRKQLRRYMKFHLNLVNLPTRIKPGEMYKASRFFSGISRVPLEDITLRIIACNMENGKYVRGSGSNRRTVSFSEPVRGVMLYEKTASQIPANVQVRDYFNEKFSFKTMFEILYPPYMVSKTHGISVYWEIQLLHPEFVDQELVGTTRMFRYEDFLVS